MRLGIAAVLALAVSGVQAQQCPEIDPAKQESDRIACKSAGGEWSRFGLRDPQSRRELVTLRTSGARLSRSLATNRHAKKQQSPALTAFLAVVAGITKD